MPSQPSIACRFARPAVPLAMLFLIATSSFAQDVLTYHNNNARTGLYTKETILTTSNVNSSTFGKLFTVPADGLVDAQPLYLSTVSVAGVAHNLLIVASEHGTVYAYDADTGGNLWHVTTLKSGETTSDNRGCSQVTPEIGVTATPVILRPKTGNPIIFVVAMSKDNSGTYHQRLHALDATTGAEVRGGPVDISATYPGTGDNSSGGKVIFDPAQYKERAGRSWSATPCISPGPRTATSVRTRDGLWVTTQPRWPKPPS